MERKLAFQTKRSKWGLLHSVHISLCTCVSNLIIDYTYVSERKNPITVYFYVSKHKFFFQTYIPWMSHMFSLRLYKLSWICPARRYAGINNIDCCDWLDKYCYYSAAWWKHHCAQSTIAFGLLPSSCFVNQNVLSLLCQRKNGRASAWSNEPALDTSPCFHCKHSFVSVLFIRTRVLTKVRARDWRCRQQNCFAR